MESELELDEELKKLHIIATTPTLYPEMIELNTITSLLALLSHENVDISVDVIDLFKDFTDEENLADASDEGKQLVKYFGDNQGFEILVNNMKRLDPSQPDEARAIYSSLSLLENCIELNIAVCDILVTSTEIQNYLLTRIQQTGFDENKLYSSELLAILLQTSKVAQESFGKERIEQMLISLAYFKKKSVASNISSDEEEFVENLFDSLCSLLQLFKNQQIFMELEGIDLMLLLLK
jgi:beta-catenin-like protein 1